MPLLAAAALGLILVGLAFKVSAAPFHVWTPDVYQGAPTPVVGFMSTAPKAAAPAPAAVATVAKAVSAAQEPSTAPTTGSAKSTTASDSTAGSSHAAPTHAVAGAAAAKAALKDPKDVAKTMKAVFPEMDEALVEEQFMTIVPLIENDITKAEGFGTLDKTRLAKTWEWTAKAQNTPLDKLDPEKVVNRSFLAK